MIHKLEIIIRTLTNDDHSGALITNDDHSGPAHNSGPGAQSEGAL